MHRLKACATALNAWRHDSLSTETVPPFLGGSPELTRLILLTLLVENRVERALPVAFQVERYVEKTERLEDACEGRRYFGAERSSELLFADFNTHQRAM